MSKIQELIDGLTSCDDKHAYKCLKVLEGESSYSSDVYPYFDIFVEMLSSTNSYIRSRGIILLAANAKWDIDNKIDEVIDEYLKHIVDNKPITARQCIKVLPTIAKYKPDLKSDIKIALHQANLLRYKDSMKSLILKDIQEALEAISKL